MGILLRKRVVVIIVAFTLVGVVVGITALLLRDGQGNPQAAAESHGVSADAGKLLTAAELLSLGEKYLLDLDYEKAVVSFTQLIQIEPRNPRGYLSLAEAYLAQGEAALAIDALQNGFEQLLDDRGFLRDAVVMYQKIIAVDPDILYAYLGLADVYAQLGDDETVIEVLKRGLDRLPDNERIAQRYYELIIPDYSIEQTYYEEVRADDDVLIWRDERIEPVFIGASERVKKMNAVFASINAGWITPDQAEYLLDAYSNHEDYTYIEANDGRVGGYAESVEESFRKNQYIAFTGKWVWDGLGGHFGKGIRGYAFDCTTGELLKITDVLSVNADRLVDTLYGEYLSYHAALGDAFCYLAQGYDDEAKRGSINIDYIENVKAQCDENAVFWLAEDGIHIVFGDLTFYRDAGPSELVIPYSRFDLVSAPFVEQLNDWRAAYRSLLSAKKSDIMSGQQLNNRPIPTPLIVIADLYGDPTPELVYVAREARSYRLYAWSYEKGAICMIDAKDMGDSTGIETSFGLARLKNSQLLIYRFDGNDRWRGVHECFNYLDGILVSAEYMQYTAMPFYLINGEKDDGYLFQYEKDNVEITEGEHAARVETLLSSIETPLIAFDTIESSWTDPFKSDLSMTYEEAMAHLAN